MKTKKNTMQKWLRNLNVYYSLFIAVLFFLFCLPKGISAQGNNNLSTIFLLDKNDFNPYVEFFSEDIKDMFHPSAGNPYPSSNLFDGYLKTCWVSGSSKTNKNNAIYIRLPDKINLDKIILNIFSGYGKSKKLFYANARPKKINLCLFAAFYPDGFSTEVASFYILKEYGINKTINLTDTFGIQSFPLNFNEKALLEFQKQALEQAKKFSGPQYKKLAGGSLPRSFSPSFIIKLKITDSYPGIKYDDVCISEIFFNNRFITPYPDKYFQISNVYIKNDNTLLADITGKKGVVIYKDTSSVFTYVDWPENAGWAILHSVPNNAVGEGSREEEQYLLIDLKNRKIANKEFEKYTNTSVMFQVLDKTDDGKIYIDNDRFKIELK
ncbi:hypothetical protein J7K93_00590 [bacterium]|nr:hypothetical protein [bacterium]